MSAVVLSLHPRSVPRVSNREPAEARGRVVDLDATWVTPAFIDAVPVARLASDAVTPSTARCDPDVLPAEQFAHHVPRARFFDDIGSGPVRVDVHDHACA
jgi:hypothetical protein